jgi:hypothetical protein
VELNKRPDEVGAVSGQDLIVVGVVGLTRETNEVDAADGLAARDKPTNVLSHFGCGRAGRKAIAIGRSVATRLYGIPPGGTVDGPVLGMMIVVTEVHKILSVISEERK